MSSASSPAREVRRARAPGRRWIAAALSLACCDAPPLRPAVDSGQDIPRVPLPPRDPELATQYRGDPRHRGVAPLTAELRRAPALAWKSEPLAIGTYSASKSSPAIDEQLVYVGVDDGSLRALGRDDGIERWRFETRRFAYEAVALLPDHRGVHGSPAFDDERVYIGDYDGWLYAVDKHTGALAWEAELGGSIGASPVLYGAFVFLSVEHPEPDGQVFIVRAETGERVYVSESLGDHPHGSVSIDPARGYLFVGANNGRMWCFDFVNKREVWRRSLGGEIKATAAVGQHTVYITSWDERLHAIDIDSGDERFAFSTEDMIMSSPSVHDGLVVFGSNDDHVYALDAQDGILRWSHGTGGSVTASATIVRASSTVLIGSRSGALLMLDLHTGARLWQHTLDGGFTAVPVIAGDSLFVNDDTGTVWRFDAAP